MVEVSLNLVNICFWFRSSRVFYLCLPSIAYQKDHYFIANMLEILFNTDEFLINLLVARYVSSIAFEMKLPENLNFQFSVMNENIQFSCYCFCIIWVFYNFGNCVSPELHISILGPCDIMWQLHYLLPTKIVFFFSFI